MGSRLGLIAGAGELSRAVLAEAKKSGLFCAVAGLRGAAPAGLEREADAFAWFGPADLDELAAFFRGHGIREAVMFGKIEHRLIFGEALGNGAIRALAAALPDHSPSTLLRALIEYLGAAGITVCDPSRFLEPYGCPEGVLVPAAAPEAVETETAFGWPLVRTLADLDIGQTLVVKDRAVVAVEGMEGTDETVRRAAALAGPGVVVLKAARTRQDPRVDLPMVGLETVRTLVEARAAALVVEAGRVPFFQREEARAAAAAGGVALIGRR